MMAALHALSFPPFSNPPLRCPLSAPRRPALHLSRARELQRDLCSAEELALTSPEKPTTHNILADLNRAIALRTHQTHDPKPTKNRPQTPPAAEPGFQTTLAELLGGSGVVPVSVSGDAKAPITGIQNDSRKVSPGDLFVCCVGSKADGHDHILDAVRRGATAVMASTSRTTDIDRIPGCRALVVVEDTNSALPALAACFYRNPSNTMPVIGITGTNGKTTTTHLVKGVYEAMQLRTGMLGTVGYYVHGSSQLEVPNTTPNAITVQKLMAEMVRKGTQAVVMEASSHGLAQGRCDEVDFNVAVFTNLTRDHYDFHLNEEEYRSSKAILFAKMLDPGRHRKVVNIDDPNAQFFVEQGNRDVPTVTFAMENMDADVFPLHFELSFSRTEVLVCTPKGVLQIVSGLLGRHNVYNILAAVAVGIAVDAPLEAIVRGIEGVDGVPGRCEVIDEEQPFGVIVDFAHTPDAISRLLDTVKEMGARRIITVVGCSGESDRGKRPIMTKIATDKSDVVILSSDNPKSENPLDIIGDMMAGVGWTIQDYVQYAKMGYYPTLANGHRILVHDNRRVAVRAAIAMAEKGDVVVVAGRGHETYQQEGDMKKYIDDREECRDALHYVEKLRRVGLDKIIPTLDTVEQRRARSLLQDESTPGRIREKGEISPALL